MSQSDSLGAVTDTDLQRAIEVLKAVGMNSVSAVALGVAEPARAADYAESMARVVVHLRLLLSRDSGSAESE
jgi:hypothetical protein